MSNAHEPRQHTKSNQFTVVKTHFKKNDNNLRSRFKERRSKAYYILTLFLRSTTVSEPSVPFNTSSDLMLLKVLILALFAPQIMVIRNESHEKANNSKQMKTKRNKSFSRLMWLHLNYKVIKSLNRNMELFRFINGIERRKLIQHIIGPFSHFDDVVPHNGIYSYLLLLGMSVSKNSIIWLILAYFARS